VNTLPTTPEAWLEILARRLDERYTGSNIEGEYPGVEKLRRYARGRADLPEMGKNVKASWEAFQKKARTNYGGAAVSSLANRISTNGLRIGESDKHPALAAARRLWRDNRLDVQVKEAIRDYIETRYGYLVVGVDEEGHAAITREKPEQFIADPDPLRPWKARATLKVWRDDVTKQDYAIVTMPGLSQSYSRDSRTSVGSMRVGAGGDGWTPFGDPVEYAGSPTVGILDRGDLGAFLEQHLDIIDRINLGKLNRLVTTAMQAFRQRALKPKDEKSGGLPQKDEQGNDINWAAALEPAPGAVWDLPVAIDIWESQPTDITPLLAGEKTDARDFSATVGTPIWVLLPGGDNQSAAAADGSKEPEVFQARDDIARIKPALAVVMVYALRVEGIDLGDDTLEVLFDDPTFRSITEKYDAAVKAKAAGESWKSIATNILGYSPDQITQDAIDRAAEQLATAPVAEPASPQPPAPTPTPDDLAA
jgi:hypothetical protein